MVACFGSISCISSLLMLGSIFLFKIYRKVSGRLLIALCLSDLFQSFAVQLTWRWKNGLPSDESSGFCSFQGFFFTFGAVSSAISILNIAIYSFSLAVYDRQFERKHEIAAYIGNFGVSAFLALTEFGVPIVNDESFFGDGGVWCWIGNNYDIHRLLFQWLWIYIIFFVLIGIYVAIGIRVYRIYRRTSSMNTYGSHEETMKRIHGLFKKMAGYPTVYFIVFFPLGVVRLVQWSHHVPDPNFTIFASAIFSLNGFMNVLVYGTTRRVLFQYRSIFDSCRRAVSLPIMDDSPTSSSKLKLSNQV